MTPISLVVVYAFCLPSFGQTVDFDGQSYEAVDWDSNDNGIATGTAGTNTVTFEPHLMSSGSISTFNDYATDTDAYGALSFAADDDLETLAISAGPLGTNTLSFSGPVDSVLVIVGEPNEDNQASTQFGPATWDFDDSLTLTIVDTEVLAEGMLELMAGNVVDNTAANEPSSPNPLHISGVFRIQGNALTSITFDQTSGLGLDVLSLTFAIHDAPLIGDVNCDGVINLLDVAPFISVLSQGIYDVKADINMDGIVNLLDVQPFIQLLGGP